MWTALLGWCPFGGRGSGRLTLTPPAPSNISGFRECAAVLRHQAAGYEGAASLEGRQEAGDRVSSSGPPCPGAQGGLEGSSRWSESKRLADPVRLGGPRAAVCAHRSGLGGTLGFRQLPAWRPCSPVVNGAGRPAGQLWVGTHRLPLCAAALSSWTQLAWD